MGRIDCNLTMNYAKERNRMCESYNLVDCKGNCELDFMKCNSLEDLTQEYIGIVQKWSDEHPVRDTKKELLALKTVRKMWEVDPRLKDVSYLSKDGNIDGTEIPEIINTLIERLEGGEEHDT